MDENSNPPSVATVAVVLDINPVDHATVHVRENDTWYDFDGGSIEEPDGKAVIATPFVDFHGTPMAGRWIARERSAPPEDKRDEDKRDEDKRDEALEKHMAALLEEDPEPVEVVPLIMEDRLTLDLDELNEDEI